MFEDILKNIQIDQKAYEKKKKEFEAIERLEKLQKLKERIRESGLTEEEVRKLKDWKFLEFQYGSKHTKRIKDKIVSWIREGYKDKPFLILYGNKGTGKTTLAKKILVLKLSKYSVHFITHNRFNLKLYEFDKQSEFLDYLIDVDFLAIDDIGTAKETDYNFSKLFMVIDERYALNKPTIITTNTTFEDVKQINETKVSGKDRELVLMLDRFMEKGLFIRFDYPSLRNPKLLKQAQEGNIKLESFNNKH